MIKKLLFGWFIYRKDLNALHQWTSGNRSAENLDETAANGKLVYDPGHPEAVHTYRGVSGYRKASWGKGCLACFSAFFMLYSYRFLTALL